MVKMPIKDLSNVAGACLFGDKLCPIVANCSAGRYLAEWLAQVAVDQAKRLGVEVVGFSGGVAYNEHITYGMRRLVEKNKLRFVAHKSMPAGDGGVSFGQSVAAAWKIAPSADQNQIQRVSQKRPAQAGLRAVI